MICELLAWRECRTPEDEEFVAADRAMQDECFSSVAGSEHVKVPILTAPVDHPVTTREPATVVGTLALKW